MIAELQNSAAPKIFHPCDVVFQLQPRPYFQRAAAVHRALETCKELLILQRENVRRLWIECIEQKQTLRYGSGR